MNQHKHLRQLLKLVSRMELWEQLGPSVTEKEWDDFQDSLSDVRDTIKCCSNINYCISKYTLKEYNRYYKRYHSSQMSI